MSRTPPRWVLIQPDCPPREPNRFRRLKSSPHHLGPFPGGLFSVLSLSPSLTTQISSSSFNFALKVLAGDQIGDIIVVILILIPTAATATFLLLQALVALGQFAEGGQAVGAELVEDAGDEFGEFFVFAVAVDGEGVGGDGGVDCCVCD